MAEHRPLALNNMGYSTSHLLSNIFFLISPASDTSHSLDFTVATAVIDWNFLLPLHKSVIMW